MSAKVYRERRCQRLRFEMVRRQSARTARRKPRVLPCRTWFTHPSTIALISAVERCPRACRRTARRNRLAKWNTLAPLQSPPMRKHDETEKGEAFPDRAHMCARVHGQPKPGETVRDRASPSRHRVLVVTEQEDVVHVPHVSRTPELPGDEMIERVHVHVRPELAGQVANRQPAGAENREQIVSVEEMHVVLLLQDPLAAREDAIDQPEDPRITDFPNETCSQNRVIETGKELTDVTLEDETVASREMLCPVQRAMRALADPIRVRPAGKRALEQRLDLQTQCVVHHTIAERRGGDEARLRFVDAETRVPRRLVAARDEVVAQCRELVAEAVLERRDSLVPTFALRCPPVSSNQVLPRAQLVVHRRSLRGIERTRHRPPGRGIMIQEEPRVRHTPGHGAAAIRPAGTRCRTRPGTGSAVLRLGAQDTYPARDAGEDGRT